MSGIGWQPEALAVLPPFYIYLIIFVK